MNDPKHVPFLRDLAAQEWPEWDATRVIFADFLEEQGDKRSEHVRKVDPEVWVGGGWLTIRTDGYRYGYSKDFFKGRMRINPGCQKRLFKHFGLLYRVKIVHMTGPVVPPQSPQEASWPNATEKWLVQREAFDPPSDCRWGISRESWVSLGGWAFKSLKEARSHTQDVMSNFPLDHYELVEQL
jgi:uncharacterized protein (TIGR02996 family)